MARMLTRDEYMRFVARIPAGRLRLVVLVVGLVATPRRFTLLPPPLLKEHLKGRCSTIRMRLGPPDAGHDVHSGK